MDDKNLIDLITLLATIAGFITTIITIRRSRKDLKIANALELKRSLNDYREINFKLFPDGEWNEPHFNFNNISNEEFSDFNSYVGYFEVAKFMLESKSMSRKAFEVFFLYRLQNINNCKAVMQHINENKKDWKNLIKLMKTFDLNF